MLSRLFGRQPVTAQYPADHDFWYNPVEGISATGINVTPDLALKIGAVYACVRLRAETLAQLPLKTYRSMPDGGKEEAFDHPLYPILHDEPNPWQTNIEWIEMQQASVDLRGNAYNEIMPGDRYVVGGLKPLLAERMIKVERIGDQIRYIYNPENPGDKDKYLDDELFRVMGLTHDGLTGLSPIGLARESLGRSLAAQQFINRLLRQGAKPGGVLEHPGVLGEDAATRIGRDFDNEYGGFMNAGRTIVIEEGMKYHSISMSLEDLQFASLEGNQVEDIARWYRVPLHMIGSTEKVTSWGTGIEQMSIGFVIYTELPVAKRFEQRIKRSLLFGPGNFFVEFQFAGLLRGTLKERYESYAVGRNWGWLSANDIRRLENMDPLADGDVYLQPLNMVEAGANPPDTFNVQDGAEAMGLQVRMLAQTAAERVLRREVAEVVAAGKRFASDTPSFKQWAKVFYGKHANFVSQTIHVPLSVAEEYCETQRAEITRDGILAIHGWEENRVPLLVDMAMRGKANGH